MGHKIVERDREREKRRQ